jgi:hypothetical protein
MFKQEKEDFAYVRAQERQKIANMNKTNKPTVAPLSRSRE